MKAKDSKCYIYGSEMKKMHKMMAGERMVLVRLDNLGEFYEQLGISETRRQFKTDVMRVPQVVPSTELNWYKCLNVFFCFDYQNLGCM